MGPHYCEVEVEQATMELLDDGALESTPQGNDVTRRQGVAGWLVTFLIAAALVLLIGGSIGGRSASASLQLPSTRGVTMFTDVGDPCPDHDHFEMRSVHLPWYACPAEIQEKDCHRPPGIVYKGVHRKMNGEESDAYVHVLADGGNDSALVAPEHFGYLGKDIDNKIMMINVLPGREMRLKVYLSDDGKTVEKWKGVSFTFFDLDTGNGNIEYVCVNGTFESFGTTTTELTHKKVGDQTCFLGSTHGHGQDNPDDLMELTPTQLNRAVTFTFANFEEASIAIGSTPSKSGEAGVPRVFNFVAMPTLLCEENHPPPTPAPPKPAELNVTRFSHTTRQGNHSVLMVLLVVLWCGLHK